MAYISRMILREQIHSDLDSKTLAFLLNGVMTNDLFLCTKIPIFFYKYSKFRYFLLKNKVNLKFDLLTLTSLNNLKHLDGSRISIRRVFIARFCFHDHKNPLKWRIHIGVPFVPDRKQHRWLIIIT